MDRIRSSALNGLVFTGRQENIRLVRDLYQKELSRCKDNNTITPLFQSLAYSMALEDYIAEKGIERLLCAVIGNTNGVVHFSELNPHIKKFIWTPQTPDK